MGLSLTGQDSSSVKNWGALFHFSLLFHEGERSRKGVSFKESELNEPWPINQTLLSLYHFSSSIWINGGLVVLGERRLPCSPNAFFLFHFKRMIQFFRTQAIELMTFKGFEGMWLFLKCLGRCRPTDVDISYLD